MLVQVEPSRSAKPKAGSAGNETGGAARSLRRIGLIHHLGHGNLGDDATLDAVAENIRRRWSDAVIIAFTLNPVDTQERHGMPAYALRRDSKLPPVPMGAQAEPAPIKTGLKARVKGVLKRNKFLLKVLKDANALLIERPKALMQELSFLVESFRIVKSLDLSIVCGGGQLLDSWGGPWGFPYTLFKWILLARLSGARCYFLNVGAGPLRDPLSKWFIKRALFLSDYVSFRDEDSIRLVRKIGFTGRAQSFPDCVYSLTVPATPTIRGSARNSSRVVGFSPMAYYDPRRCFDKDQSAYDGHIRTLALFGSWLLHEQYRLVLFSTDIWFDAQAIEDVTTALRKDPEIAGSRSISREPVTGMEDMFSQISSTDCVVACRFHGVVFAHLMNKPVLAISTHPKVAALMEELGLSEYCVDPRTCDAAVLQETFTRLVANSDAIKVRMAEKAESYRVALQSQFDDLFPAYKDFSKPKQPSFRLKEGEL